MRMMRENKYFLSFLRMIYFKGQVVSLDVLQLNVFRVFSVGLLFKGGLRIYVMVDFYSK